MGSSHEHRVSQELGEVLSVNLSENQTHGPEHLYCEEQQSGSWNLSAFDEAAAQMQGSETSPHLTSALNDVRILSVHRCCSSTLPTASSGCFLHLNFWHFYNVTC